MKKNLFLPLALLFAMVAFNASSQDLKDTLVMKNNSRIICKIVKVTDTDIEYKKDNTPEAIIYEVDKAKVREMRLGNGTVEHITRDEMDMNPEAEIIDKRRALKVNFFSPLYNHIAFTYEKSLKMGTNLEVCAGWINNTVFTKGVSETSKSIYGATIVVGPKFLLGNSYYMKGMKFSHPLKGRFFKPEIIFTSFSVRNINYMLYPNSYYGTNPLTYKTNLNVNCVSLMLTYGTQYILGNSFTFSYNLGLGYSYVSSRYTNPDLRKTLSSNTYYYNTYNSLYTTNLFNQLRFGSNFPLACTANFTIGYIFK